MPFGAAAPIIASVAGGGLGILGGALNGKPKTSTSTTTPSWSPDMQDLLSQITAYSKGLITDPEAGTGPIKSNLQQKVNKRYAVMPAQISRELASRGYGSSGGMGEAFFRSATARSGELNDVDSAIANLILQQKNQGASLADQLLSMTRSTTTNGTGSGTAAGDALESTGNGLNSIAAMLTLSKLLKGSGGVDMSMPAGTPAGVPGGIPMFGH